MTTHRADKVVADALSDGAIRQEERGTAAVLICRRRNKKRRSADPGPTRPRWQTRCSTKRANQRGNDDRGRGRRKKMDRERRALGS
jgi:hypothetical protein